MNETIRKWMEDNNFSCNGNNFYYKHELSIPISIIEAINDITQFEKISWYADMGFKVIPDQEAKTFIYANGWIAIAYPYTVDRPLDVLKKEYEIVMRPFIH